MTKIKNYTWAFEIGENVWYKEANPGDRGMITDRTVDRDHKDSYQVMWDLDGTTKWYRPGQLVGF